jgi:hypothetical protein
VGPRAGSVSHEYLDYNIVVIKKQLMNLSPIKEMPGRSTFIIYSTHCIDEAVVFSGCCCRNPKSRDFGAFISSLELARDISSKMGKLTQELKILETNPGILKSAHRPGRVYKGDVFLSSPVQSFRNYAFQVSGLG